MTGLFSPPVTGGGGGGGGRKGERGLPEAPSLSSRVLMIRPPKLHGIKYQSFPTSWQNVIDIICHVISDVMMTSFSIKRES